MNDDEKLDALGIPYKPRPLPARPARDLLAGAAYRNSSDTDVKRTFARIRREQRREQVAAEYIPAPKFQNCTFEVATAQLLTFNQTRKVR